jgi:hypothetical protein
MTLNFVFVVENGVEGLGEGLVVWFTPSFLLAFYLPRNTILVKVYLSIFYFAAMIHQTTII